MCVENIAQIGPEALTQCCMISDANVNGKDKDGRTVLHCAAVKGYKETIQLLINTYGMCVCIRMFVIVWHICALIGPYDMYMHNSSDTAKYVLRYTHVFKITNMLLQIFSHNLYFKPECR